MKIRLILLLTMFLTLSSCWSPDYVANEKVELDPGKQQLIPYQKGQKINFVHSKGYAFDFTVTQSDLSWSGPNQELGGCIPTPSFPKTVYYTSYQSKNVVLKSEYPEIIISLSLTSHPIGANVIYVGVNSYNRYNASIRFDEHYKFASDTVGGSSVLSDSIIINGKTYNNVVEAKIGNGGSGGFKSILYNELGVLQIKLSDDETFSINN